jgi:hypothetical protein
VRMGRASSLIVMAATVFLAGGGTGTAHRVAAGTGSDTVVYAQDFTVAAGQTGGATVPCPTGMRAFDGGVGATSENPPAHQIQITNGVRADLPGNGSEPVTGWQASIYDYGSESATFRVYALCSANSDAESAGGTNAVIGSGGPNPHVETLDCSLTADGTTRVTGGGISNLTGSLSPPPDYVTSSGPSADDFGWELGVLQFVSDVRRYELLLICSPTVDYTVVEGKASLPSHGTASRTVACPEGTRAIGGGARIVPDAFGAAIDDSAPTGKGGSFASNLQAAYGWTASAANVRDFAATVIVTAFCVAEAAAPPPPPPPPPPAPPPASPPPPSGSTVPVISGVHVTPSAFRAASGATVSYQDTAASTTTVAVLRTTRGHRVAGKCRAGSGPKPCTRTVVARSFVHDDNAGADQFHLSGHGLAAGSYLLALTPHANGHAGPTVRLAFKIVG